MAATHRWTAGPTLKSFLKNTLRTISEHGQELSFE